MKSLRKSKRPNCNFSGDFLGDQLVYEGVGLLTIASPGRLLFAAPKKEKTALYPYRRFHACAGALSKASFKMSNGTTFHYFTVRKFFVSLSFFQTRSS